MGLSDIREMRKRIAAGNNRGNFWKPGKGTNLVRLIMWPSPVTGKNDEFVRQIHMHQQRGTPPSICGRSLARDKRKSEDCEKCDVYSEIFASDGREAAGEYKAKERYVFLVVPLMKGDEVFKQRKPVPFWSAKTLGEAMVNIIGDCDEVEKSSEYFGPKGLNFKITFDPTAAPVAMYSVKVLPKARSEELDSDCFTPIQDLYAADSLEPQWFLDQMAEGAADEPQEETPVSAPEPKAKAAPKPAPAPVEEVEEEAPPAPTAAQEVDYEGNAAPQDNMTLMADDDGDMVWAFTLAQVEELIAKGRKKSKFTAGETESGIGYFEPKGDGECTWTRPW